MPLAGPVFLRAGVAAPVRVSSDALGRDAAGASGHASFSPDGRTVLFESSAGNLVAGDTNGTWDVFTKDLATGIVTRVSTNAAGAQTIGQAMNAHFDASGQRVVFDSTAPDLTLQGDTNRARDVFVKDLATGGVTLVSSNAAGIVGNGDSMLGTVSPDGTRVAFESLATNFTGADTNHARDVFVKDLASGDIVRVSTDALGGEANGQSADVAWSPDGTKVLFESNASNLVAGDRNGSYDIFMKDLATGAITRVSTAADGTEANGHSVHAHFTADGRSVVFESLATNLVAGDTNGARDIFQKDLATGAVTRLSTDIAGGQAAGHAYDVAQGGGVTAFESSADLTGGDTNARRDIYVRDADGHALRVSLGVGGAEGNGDAFNAAVSADGSAVVFETAASNTVAGDANGQRDVFVARLIPSVTTGAVTQDGAAASGSIYFDDGAASATHSVSVVAPSGALGQLNATLAHDATGAGTGQIDWSFGGDGLQALGAGETAVQTYGIVVDDGQGHRATQAVTLTLTGVNDAPVAAADGLRLSAGAVLGGLGAQLLSNDADVDHGDRLHISAIDTTGTAGHLTFDPATGALSYAADATAFAGLHVGEQATDHFRYTVTDLSGATSQADVSITVDGIVPVLPPDTLRGDNNGDILEGGTGINNLYGGTGNDTLIGGEGAQLMAGGLGDDLYSVDNIGDRVVEGANGGRDTVIATIDYTLTANVEELVLVGGNLNGTGNALDNRLTGTEGANRLDGGAGADWMAGGKGNDVYVVDNVGDRVIEAISGGNDTVETTLTSYTLPANLENLTYTGTVSAVLAGNNLSNNITGGAGDDLLTGGAGSDRLTGGAGNDTLDGGIGSDQLRGGAGADTFILRPGETQGDAILDFNTSSTGDVLKLAGWGAGTTVTTSGGGNWAIHDGVDGHVETFRLIGDVHPADIVIG